MPKTGGTWVRRALEASMGIEKILEKYLLEKKHGERHVMPICRL